LPTHLTSAHTTVHLHAGLVYRTHHVTCGLPRVSLPHRLPRLLRCPHRTDFWIHHCLCCIQVWVAVRLPRSRLVLFAVLSPLRFVWFYTTVLRAPTARHHTHLTSFTHFTCCGFRTTAPHCTSCLTYAAHNRTGHADCVAFHVFIQLHTPCTDRTLSPFPLHVHHGLSVHWIFPRTYRLLLPLRTRRAARAHLSGSVHRYCRSTFCLSTRCYTVARARAARHQTVYVLRFFSRFSRTLAFVWTLHRGFLHCVFRLRTFLRWFTTRTTRLRLQFLRSPVWTAHGQVHTPGFCRSTLHVATRCHTSSSPATKDTAVHADFAYVAHTARTRARTCFFR